MCPSQYSSTHTDYTIDGYIDTLFSTQSATLTSDRDMTVHPDNAADDCLINDEDVVDQDSDVILLSDDNDDNFDVISISDDDDDSDVTIPPLGYQTDEDDSDVTIPPLGYQTDEDDSDVTIPPLT
jgi:hypothetical protein